jgi:ABC-2 type transport system ATP-binding protein
MSATAVEAEGLRKAFGRITALDGLSFQVPTGSVLGLLGPNGSGKTTTISILSTALRPDAGHATVCGLDVVGEAARVRRVIGLAGQFAAVDPNLTGRENLVLIGRLSRVGRRQARARADELLDSFGLATAAGDGSGSLPRVLRALDGRAPDPVSVSVHEPTLDDVFLTLTGATP